MSKPWGLGAWAADAEREEAEEKEQAAASAATGDSPSFPSLRDAVTTTKHKKKTKISLQEFTMQSSASGFGYQGLTPDEMLRLPTGPKERSSEEMQPRLGGGFSSYGRSSAGPPTGRRDADYSSSWGSNRRSYGGFDDDDRRPPPPRVSDYDHPSRADEVDNWAMGKKSLPSFDSGRPNRYSSLGGGGFSKADEVDNWAVGKKPLPERSSTFGSGFRDSGPEPERWTRGGFQDRAQERPRLVLDRPRISEGSVVEAVKANRPSPFGAARPREEVLADKGLDWKKMDMEIEVKKTSRPTSSQSSRPGSSHSEGSAVQIEGAVKPRPKVNPFGEAKPREVLLQERGLDWRKIDFDLEHRRVERPETEAEKNLKEEIDHLKKELEKESVSNANGETPERSGGDRNSLHDVILSKERELEVLIRELDDKVRFGPKAMERPGSGTGSRVSSVPQRPPSRSEESRSMEFMENPRSRGTGDVWARQGGRERGFLGNRDLGRSSSRERW
ncbi:hypothetical protein LguiA_000180 [Lonicera macranthoides]